MDDTFPFARCPKCLHSPLPVDQSLPAACPQCGIILAKFAAVEQGDSTNEHSVVVLDDDGDLSLWRRVKARVWESICYVPEKVSPLAFWSRCVLLAAFSIWGVRLIKMDYRELGVGESFLHGPLLIFHEAGHVIFRLFGEFLTILGGTLGQLLMPAIMSIAMLIKNRDPFAAAIGLWFFGVSVLDVAPYIYDALHPQLVLLNGQTGEEGGHDWIYLLTETGLLSRAQTIGSLTHKAGAMIVIVSMIWAGWTLWRQKEVMGRVTIDQ